MLRILTKKDIEIIINFYQEKIMFDEDYIRQLYDSLEETKLAFASVINESIDALLIVGIINHNYHLEDILTKNQNDDIIKDLLNYAIVELRRDERGLNIIYDNFPYNEIMNDIMLEQGFKCNFLNMTCLSIQTKSELIKPTILLNDKNDDVVLYMYRRLIEDIKSNDLYLGINSLIPDISTIRLENTNVAVIRNKENEVVGTLRFGIVSNSLMLDSFYANDETTYEDLINLVKNLTNKPIEISISPSRVNLIYLLERLGFKKIQADYILKLS